MNTPTTPSYSDPIHAENTAAMHHPVQKPLSPVASPPGNFALNSDKPTFCIPTNLTQTTVDANPELKRIQQDLLVLTSLPDNSSLTWRPSWFFPPNFISTHWTLHNPPHVVTEHLPRDGVLGRQVMTRRMRREGDTAPPYLKTWTQWDRYCGMYGVPRDFLCEDQIRLLRLGLPRCSDGWICRKFVIPIIRREFQSSLPRSMCMNVVLIATAPPTWPLYPEPATHEARIYILPTNENLPLKFHCTNREVYDTEECVVVDEKGALHVVEVPDDAVVCSRGKGKRWSFVPWTKEQELSCQPLRVKLRFWNSAEGVDSSLSL